MLNDLLRYHNVSIPSKYNTQLKTNKLNDLKIVCIHIFNSIMNNLHIGRPRNYVSHFSFCVSYYIQ